MARPRVSLCESPGLLHPLPHHLLICVPYVVMLRVTTLVSKALTLDSARVTRMSLLTTFIFAGVIMYVLSLRTHTLSSLDLGVYANIFLGGFATSSCSI